MRFLVPLVAALVPLLITPGLLSYFDVTPKIAILLFGAALSLLYLRQNARNLRTLVSAHAGRWFVALMAAQWLASAIATVFSSNPELSLNGGIWRRFGLISETGLILFVVLAAAWLVVDRRNVVTLLRGCTLSGGLAALYGISQYFGLDPLLPARAYQVGEGVLTIVRPPGTLGHADYFAAWLVMVTFFAFALAEMEENKWWKIASGAVSMLAILAILLSGTRAALLGLLAGALVYGLSRRHRLRARTVVVGLACAAGLVVFFFSPAGTKLRARLHWSLEDARGGARLLLWRDSLRMASHRPIAGFGPETFGTEFPRFESIELARAYPDFYHESPHNMFLDAFTEQGIIGLLALIGLCGLGLWVGLPGLRSGQRVVTPLAAGMVGILVAQQFAVSIVATSLYFYLLIALLVAAAIPLQTPQTNDAPRSYRPLLSFGLVVGVVLVVFTVRLLVADHALASSYREIESGDAHGAARAYALALRWRPAGSGADLDYSRAMTQLAIRTPVFATRLQARPRAIEAGIRATLTAEDRQNAWYNLAVLFASQNDADSVEHSLRNAIAWAPNWFKPHWTLAQLLELKGNHAEALAEAAAAVERDGGRDPEVTETWKKLQQAGAGH